MTTINADTMRKIAREVREANEHKKEIQRIESRALARKMVDLNLDRWLGAIQHRASEGSDDWSLGTRAEVNHSEFVDKFHHSYLKSALKETLEGLGFRCNENDETLFVSWC